jgi:hypothetical protein
MTLRETVRAIVAAARGQGRRRSIALAAFVVVAALAVVGLKVTSYVRNDQRFCAAGCHAPKDPAGAWHTRGHEAVPCQSCHTTSASTAGTLLWKQVIGAKDAPKHGKARVSECTNCHEKKPVEWRQIEATEGHRAHRGVKKLDCLSCHADNAHDTAAPTEKLCLKCHEPARLHKTTPDTETCLSCHAFAVSPRLARKPTAVGCASCHADSKAALPAAMKLVNEQTIHGGLDCKLCHAPHGHKPVVPEGQPVCARCHQLELVLPGGGKAGPEGHRDCEGCHKPHSLHKTALQSCAKCHEKNAIGLAGAPGQSTALKHQSCASCHLPHTWRAQRSGCVQCHEDKAQLLLTRSPPQHGTCTSCHEVHGPPPTGAVCVTCHAKTKGNHVALAPERHKDCTTCHNPHAPSPKDTRTVCAKCHLSELSGMARGPEGHLKDACFGCHQPHENPRPPANVCSKCHTDNARLVATAAPALHRTCTSCHEGHQFAIKDVASACLTCHGATPEGRKPKAPEAGLVDLAGPHQGECKTCHTLHGSPGVPKAACFQCHDKVKSQFKPPNETHGNCRSCHQPHTPASTAPARCVSCHDVKAMIAARWPASSAHAQACTGCHQPHDVREKKACSTCHQAEAKSAMGGKHQCSQCHQPHMPPPGTGAAWWSRCDGCHAAKVESVKARGPKHSDCKNCHQPHKFEAPKCTSCHQEMGGKGLHAVARHAESCEMCHDPHVKSETTRTQCLSCHSDRRQHEPTAQKCQTCHPFK